VNTRTAFFFSGALTLAMAGCTAQEFEQFGSPLVASHSTAFTIGVAPSTLALVSFGSGHAGFCSPFGATFDLIVHNTGTADLLVDEASFRLIDGTTLGGSPITIPSAEMSRRFGRPLVRRGTRRAFRFNERFGCDILRPRSLRIHTRFLVVGGGSAIATVDVPAA
jgi:hypothetical protein